MWKLEERSVACTPPPAVRSAAAAVLSMGSSKVLTICGGYDGGIEAKDEIYGARLEAFNTGLTWKLLGHIPRLHDHTLVDCDGRAFIFGGASGGTFSCNTLELELVENGDAIVRALAPSGCIPSPRANHSAVAWNGALWVFGGCDFQHDTRLYNDLFTFDGQCWREVRTKGGPCPRSGHSCVLWKNSLCFFGGWDGDTVLQDTFLWNGISWKCLKPCGQAPSPRACHIAAIFANDQMIIYGGLASYDQGDGGAACVSSAFVDILDLSLHQWTNIKAIGHNPVPRAFHCAAVLPALEQKSIESILIFGGGSSINDTSTNYNDTIEFKRIVWHPASHHLFPLEARRLMYIWLLVHSRLTIRSLGVSYAIASFFMSGHSAEG